jgi:hypothetical protein
MQIPFSKRLFCCRQVLQTLLTNPLFNKLLSSVEDLAPYLADKEDLHLNEKEKKEAEAEEEVRFFSKDLCHVYFFFSSRHLFFRLKRKLGIKVILEE